MCFLACMELMSVIFILVLTFYRQNDQQSDRENNQWSEMGENSYMR